MSLGLHCGSKNWTPVTFSNHCNKYLSVLIIFRTANLQTVYSLHVCNWRILIKLGTSFLYFHCSGLYQMTLIMEMGLCKENHILFFKNLYEFEYLELTDPWKSLQQKDRQRSLGILLKLLKDQLQQRLSAVWSDSCRWGNWRMETISPGLCLWNGTPFWTFVTVMVVACPLLTFSRWMVEHFMITLNILLQ